MSAENAGFSSDGDDSDNAALVPSKSGKRIVDDSAPMMCPPPKKRKTDEISQPKKWPTGLLESTSPAPPQLSRKGKRGKPASDDENLDAPRRGRKRCASEADLDEDDESDDKAGAASSVGTTSAGRSKRCRLCKTWSTAETPITNPSSRLMKQWGQVVPWGEGVPGRPKGRYDLICIRSFVAGSFDCQHKSIGLYRKWLVAHPEEHQKFLTARQTWIALHNANPQSRQSKGKLHNIVALKVSVQSGDEDGLSAPEEEFITMAAWNDKAEIKEYKKKHGQFPDPALFKARKATRTFRGQVMEGVMVMVGKEGHYKVHKRHSRRVRREEVLNDDDEAEIREGQALMKSAAAVSGALAGADSSSTHIDDVLALIAGYQAPEEKNDDEAKEAEVERDMDNSDDSDNSSDDDRLDQQLEQTVTKYNNSAAPSSRSATTASKGKGKPGSPAQPAKASQGGSGTAPAKTLAPKTLPTATATGPAPAKATSTAKGLKWDEAAEKKQLNGIVAKLEALSDFGAYVPETTGKEFAAMIKVYCTIAPPHHTN